MESFQNCPLCSFKFDTKERAPKSLPCGHTLCLQCLANRLEQPNFRRCPFDNEPFNHHQNSVNIFPYNFVLLGFLQQKEDDTCQTHEKKLKLFCLTDKKKLCSECLKDEKHNDHAVRNIKELKTQGAKVTRELESTLFHLTDSVRNQEENRETMRKELLSTIDRECRDIKDIIIEKHFELRNHINNIFSSDKQKTSEDTFALKQQLDESIKDIKHASGDHGNLLVLENAINNKQLSPQFLEVKSLEMHSKFLKMQKALEQSLNSLKKAVDSLELSSEEIVKEIYSGQEESQLSETHQKLKVLKFLSYFNVIKNLKGDLEISALTSQQVRIEVKEGDFKAIESIEIKLVCYDFVTKELIPNLLTYILRRLENLTSLKVSFDWKEFNRYSIAWIATIISASVQNLKFLALDFEKCCVSGESLTVLANLVFSKMENLRDFVISLDSSQVKDSDLKILFDSIKPFSKNFECFALGLAHNSFTENTIVQMHETIQSMEKLKTLQLNLSGTNIFDGYLQVLGKNLQNLRALDSFMLDISKCKISEKGILAIFKLLENLKRLELDLSHTSITDQTVNALTDEVKQRLEPLKSLTFVANNPGASKKYSWEIRDIIGLEKKEEHQGS